MALVSNRTPVESHFFEGMEFLIRLSDFSRQSKSGLISVKADSLSLLLIRRVKLPFWRNMSTFKSVKLLVSTEEWSYTSGVFK